MKRIEILDYGRFISIISVIFFHYFFNGIQNGKINSLSYIPVIVDFAKYGYLGVEFFFIISGYVIFFSSLNRSASQFAVARAVRLYPAFFVAVIFTSCFAFLWGRTLMSVSIPQILANFTIFAPLFGYSFVDGVYWSLTYEIQFYFAVFLLLSLGLQGKLELIFMSWPIVMLAAKFFNMNHLVFLGGYYCYFAAGTVLAIMQRKPNITSFSLLITSIFLCIDFSLENAAKLSASKGIFISEQIIATLIVMFFLFFIFVNTRIGTNLKLFGSRLIGGITYPLYLIHAHFGYMLLSRFATDYNKAYLYPLTIIIVLFIAFLIHIVVEKKFAPFWNSLFQNLIGYPTKIGSEYIAYLRLQAKKLF